MSDAFACAVRLLTRREHGARELADKLKRKGYLLADIEASILECQRLGLQSDSRFVESLCRTRVRQGYGPLRIRQELQHLQVDGELIEDVLQQEQDNWLTYATDVWKKKYKVQTTSYTDLQKQKQFLMYRGFPMDIIAKVFRP